jgi:hypothetical protein
MNIPLLRKAVEWVEEQDALATSKRKWYQGSWAQKRIDAAQENVNDPFCHTAVCVAGKIALDAGWVPVWDDQNEAMFYADRATKNGVTLPIEHIAARELGLDVEDANDLFDGNNQAADIRMIAESIAGERL